MPFINGRYHINPTFGQALEDARSAAEELLASDDASHSSPDDDLSDRANSEDKSPIHHIEIEATEVVPSSKGRATHGFVARVHRRVSIGAQSANNLGRMPGADARHGVAESLPLRPETHVFADHRDLLDFLRSELANDCARS
ncbi:MAG TPA: hypothetical protein VEJ38_13405 [Candidatus Acidoferrales bacterium]|nr:hypothetical protein [Candidatus Acidoferrales bacterium]